MNKKLEKFFFVDEKLAKAKKTDEEIEENFYITFLLISVYIGIII